LRNHVVGIDNAGTMANLDDKVIYEVADWMEDHGYQFDRDRDGFWFEEEITEHRLCDIMELMVDYAEYVKSKG
jgi:hypothetical protein